VWWLIGMMVVAPGLGVAQLFELRMARSPGRVSPSRRVLDVPSVTMSSVIRAPYQFITPRTWEASRVLPASGLARYPGWVSGLRVGGVGWAVPVQCIWYGAY